MLLQKEAGKVKESGERAKEVVQRRDQREALFWKVGVIVEAEVKGTRSCDAKHEKCYCVGTAVKALNGLMDIGRNMCNFLI